MAPTQIQKEKYPVVCPHCKKNIWVELSCAMRMGINSGHGLCPFCKTFLSFKHRKKNGKRIIIVTKYNIYREKKND
jgi:uncharacterized protein YbaR (Trm112 family)